MRSLRLWVYVLLLTSLLVSVLYPFHSPIRYLPSAVTMVLILQLWILYLVKFKRHVVLPRTSANWALYCYLSLIIITIILTKKGIAYIGIGLVVLVAYVFMYNFFKVSENNNFMFLKALHVFGIIFSVLGIAFFLLGLNYPLGSTTFQKIFGNVKLGNKIFLSSLFHNENIFGALLMFSIPATLTLYLMSKDKYKMRKARYYLIVITLLVVVLWKSDSRAAWLATGISVIYITAEFVRKKIIVLLFITIIVIIATLISLERTSFNTIASLVKDPGMRGRLLIWKEGLYLVRKSPVVGVGVTWTREAIELLLPSPVKVQTMHNNYLRMSLELGLPGLVIYLWFLVAVLKKSMLNIRIISFQSNRRYLIFATGVFIGNLFYQLFEDPIFGGFGFQNFFFLATVAMILSMEQREGRKR